MCKIGLYLRDFCVYRGVFGDGPLMADVFVFIRVIVFKTNVSLSLTLTEVQRTAAMNVLATVEEVGVVVAADHAVFTAFTLLTADYAGHIHM